MNKSELAQMMLRWEDWKEWLEELKTEIEALGNSATRISNQGFAQREIEILERKIKSVVRQLGKTVVTGNVEAVYNNGSVLIELSLGEGDC